MSRKNLAESLGAVETALAHLASSLEAAGFAAGAATYQKMTDVVIGQRMWAAEHGIDEFDEQYGRVSDLATKVYEYLVPYVEVASRLATLRQLPSREGSSGPAGPAGLAGEILSALESADRPLPATRIGSLLKAPTSEIRKQLEELVASGRVERHKAGGRALFRVA